MSLDHPSVSNARTVEDTALTAHTMTGRLERVLVCTPAVAGWDDRSRSNAWRDLGFLRPPDGESANLQHRRMSSRLADAGVEIVELTAVGNDLSVDAVYTHDASLVTRWGGLILRPAKQNREIEGAAHEAVFRTLGIPVLGKIVAPGTVEGGDIVWLDETTLLVGRGYRTNSEGIRQIRDLLEPRSITVPTAPLLHGDGPDACLHLMSLISLLNRETALVDLRNLAVETIELLVEHGFRLLEIDPAERETLACNVLSIDGHRLLALEENRRTNKTLVHAGFDVITFSGSEIGINGSGGPTCLTRPLRRRAEMPDSGSKSAGGVRLTLAKHRSTGR